MASATDKLAAAAQPAADDRTVDYRIGQFILAPRDDDAPRLDVAENIIGSSLTMSMEGASTLEITVQDEDFHLFRSGYFTSWLWGKNADHTDQAAWIRDGVAIDATLDDLEFRLSDIDFDDDPVNGPQLKLTFEDKIVTLLRGQRGRKKAYRDKVTRAEFVAALCREARVPFWIPKEHFGQPTAQPAQDTASTAPDRRTRSAGGTLTLKSGIKIKGVAADQDQLSSMNIALAIASGLNAPSRAIIAMLVAGTGESSWRKGATEHVYGTHHGVFQSYLIPAQDVAQQAKYFLIGGRSFLAGGAIGLVRTHPSMKVGEVAARVEISDGSHAYYQGFADEAVRNFNIWGGRPDSGTVATDDTTEQITVQKRYPFTRGRNENSWDCQRRLGDEVNWRRFARSGFLIYISETDLIKYAPNLIIERGQDGVETISGGLNPNARDLVAELTVTAVADRWTALPGMVVRIPDMGSASGDWLVSTVTPSLTGAELATITLRKAVKPKKEPAAETKSRSITVSGGKEKDKLSELVARKASPKEIIDRLVLPIGRAGGATTPAGTELTPSNVTTMNAQHGSTLGGSRSDHQGPPDHAWAVDMSIGPDIRGGGNKAGAKKGDEIAKQVADLFDINWPGRGLISTVHDGYQFQVIWRYIDAQAGNHYTHVHAGIHRM